MSGLDTAVRAKVDEWLRGDYDAHTKSAIQVLLDTDAHEELSDAFYKDLEFGTGGLRGIMGPGTNRVNKYTIGMATQGLANWLNQQYEGQSISVVIAHDCRNDSDTLSKVTADVFTANGIKVYFFDGLRPTPELSFAIRHLGAKSGVMLTASHNPKEYNGYKAYGHDGCQLVSPADKEVLAEVRKVRVTDVKFDRNADLFELIGKKIDELYLDELMKLRLSSDAVTRQRDLKIVFSPIHGTGGGLVPPLLSQMGFDNVILVEEQMKVDGDFPTVIYPNPEEAEALKMAIERAQIENADLVMATDPDADRVGIAIKNKKGEHILLNGNQTAVLLFNYVLDRTIAKAPLKGNEYIVKTIVTSYMLDKIAHDKNVECFNTLTGFKHIGAVMTSLEDEKKFIVGGEESYGYLVGDHARDKDAVISCGMIAEMAAYYADQGKSLYDALLDLYVKYGAYQESLVALTKKGKSGAEEIKALIEGFRSNPPSSFGGSEVVRYIDFQTQVDKNLVTGEETKVDLPVSNVLQFHTKEGSVISARPSGTEPKVKFYCSVNAPLSKVSDYDDVKVVLDAKIEALKKDLGVS